VKGVPLCPRVDESGVDDVAGGPIWASVGELVVCYTGALTMCSVISAVAARVAAVAARDIGESRRVSFEKCW
jgi:hypothetical protein